MAGGMLIFASKEVGFELLRYLISSGAPIRKIIVAKYDDKQIQDYLKKHHLEYEIYSQQVCQRLVDENVIYDWLLNLWSPHILTKQVLMLALHRLNIHPGIVPVCRGNDNAAWAIRKGLPAGVSLLEMTEEVDSGDVYASKEVLYRPTTYGKELHLLLQKTAINLFKESWPNIFSKKIKPHRQKGHINTFTRSKTDKDRCIDHSATMTLDNFVKWCLAHDFNPGTTAEMIYGEKIYKLCLSIEEKK